MRDFPGPDSVQTYVSHARYFPPIHFFASPILAINALWALVEFFKAPAVGTGRAALVALALAVLVVAARVMALRVQDRVIRLEETLRLERLLGAERRFDIEKLTLKQLIGLRFAPDPEVPHLVERIQGGELQTDDDVKRAIQHWRADFLRV